MRFLTVAAVTFFIISSLSQARESNQISITGKVVDQATGAPLEFVNVFLANTTIGTTTGNDGEFSLNNIPYGVYDVVFSYVGYETEKRNFSSYNPRTFKFNISLKPKAINLNSISITAAVPEEWRDNLKLFKGYFIGETSNAEKTKILNPEVLNFVRDEKTKKFKAGADSVLRIENRGLGYMLYVVLDSLIYLPNEYIRYIYEPRFEELKPASETEKQQWEENRRKTFLNSPKHFFYSLVHNSLFKDHFTLKYTDGANIIPEYLDLSTDTDSTIFVLKFDGVLQVKRSTGKPSFLNFYFPSISIDKYGNLQTFFSNVGIFGFWADQRIADVLPMDYVYIEK